MSLRCYHVFRNFPNNSYIQNINSSKICVRLHHQKHTKSIIGKNFELLQSWKNVLPLSFNSQTHYARLFHSVDDFSQASLTHIKTTLTSKDIDFEDGFTSLIIKCPICSNAKKNEMHINKVTGLVICMGCKRFGQWDELEEMLLKEKKNVISEQLLKKFNNEAGDKWKELSNAAVPLKSLEPEIKKKIFQEMNLSFLSDDVIDHLNLYTNEDLSSLYVPLSYASGSDIVGYKTVNILKKKDSNDNSDSEDIPCLFNSELTEPCRNCRGIVLHKSKNFKKDKAILVHDIKDFISLANLNLNYNTICLPHGLTSLPQEVLPVLEKYKKIILWFGNDAGSWDAARQFAKKLGHDRCYFVRPMEKNPPAHVIAMQNDAVEETKRIVDTAEPIKHPSIIDFSIIRQDVLSELQNIDKVEGVKWQRFPGLNNLLKGFRRGELTILTGPTGSGKTTFLSEYSLDLLTQGVATLWGSFEVRNQRLARTMLQQYVQAPLELHPEKLNYWADNFERLPLHFLTFHGQQPLKVVLEAVQHASYVYDTAHVIIDNVQFMLGLLDSESHIDRFYRQDALIAAFRCFATLNNCHVTLVIHPRKERDAEQLTISSVFGGAKASQEADNVLIIQQKILQSLKIKKFLQVAKNRFSGDLGLIPLEFHKESLSFSIKPEKKPHKNNSNHTHFTDASTSNKRIEDLHILQ